MASVFVATTLAQGALQALLIWSLRNALRGLDRPESGTLAALSVGAAIVMGIWMLRAACTFLGEVLSARLAHRVEQVWIMRLLQKLLTLSVRFFDKSSQGDLVLASYHDIKAIRLVTMEVGNVILYVTRLSGLAVVAWLMSPELATVGLMILPLGFIPAHRLALRVTRAADREREALAGMSESFLQVSSGIRVIKVNRSEASVMHQARAQLHELYIVTLRQAEARGLGRLLFDTVTGAGLVVVLMLGGRQVAAGELEWQSLLSLLIAILAVYAPVMGLVGVQHTLSAILPNLDRLERILSAPVEVPDRPDARRLREAPRVIQLEELSFAYDSQLVLNDLTATFQRGERIGIVGPSGSGKSTLIALLLRLYDPTGGRILFDGVDLRDIRHADLLDLCAIVPQEPFMFWDTIANNIRATVPNASQEAVEAAARSAHVHDEIMRMEQGYDAFLGRRRDGRGISVGQKQRLAIASALLKNASMLFLDEATSSLDSLSELAVQAAVERLMEGRTTFIIAHRLSTLRMVDRILVLQEGRIAGLGTHEELMQCCPTYQHLWKHQMLEGGARRERMASSSQ
jgi:subfamily B ATP-binding cassette protein MsbA